MNIVHFVNGVHETGRSRRRAARRAEILDAAAGLLASEGLPALTLARVASELGYVAAALYRYFDSKEALLAELQRRTIQELSAGFEQERKAAAQAWREQGFSKQEEPLAELWAGVGFYLALPQTAPERFRLVGVMLTDPRPLVDGAEALKSAPVLMAFLGEVRSLLAAAEDSGALTPGSATDRTLALWSTLQGAAQLDKLARFDSEYFDAVRIGKSAARALLLGFGARPETLDRLERNVSAPAALARRGSKPRSRRS
ncbi:MAG: helix-turn-helix transcriptional regulator [Myxococcales bacterium]|nr:helix-turn-helix transcriptional regulator [Myxococcales bacterium]MCB9578685.1 helix-turn-helix transcriptional regulator [Polyangiaceae bacterium]